MVSEVESMYEMYADKKRSIRSLFICVHLVHLRLKILRLAAVIWHADLRTAQCEFFDCGFVGRPIVLGRGYSAVCEIREPYLVQPISNPRGLPPAGRMPACPDCPYEIGAKTGSKRAGKRENPPGEKV